MPPPTARAQGPGQGAGVRCPTGTQLLSGRHVHTATRKHAPREAQLCRHRCNTGQLSAQRCALLGGQVTRVLLGTCQGHWIPCPLELSRPAWPPPPDFQAGLFLKASLALLTNSKGQSRAH